MSLEQFDHEQQESSHHISPEQTDLQTLEQLKGTEIQEVQKQTRVDLKNLQDQILQSRQKGAEAKENTEEPRLPVFDEIDSRLQRGYDYTSQMIDDMYDKFVTFQTSKENRKALRKKEGGVDFQLPNISERNTKTPNEKMGILIDLFANNNQMLIFDNIKLENGFLGIGGRLLECHGKMSYTLSPENGKTLYNIYNLNPQETRNFDINFIDARSQGNTAAYKFDARFMPYGKGHILFNNKQNESINISESAHLIQNEISHKLFYEQYILPKGLDFSKKVSGAGINQLIGAERFSFPDPTVEQIDEFISDTASIGKKESDIIRIITNNWVKNIGGNAKESYKYSNYFTTYLLKAISSKLPDFKKSYEDIINSETFSRNEMQKISIQERNQRLQEFRSQMRELMNKTFSQELGSGNVGDFIRTEYREHAKQLLEAVKKLR